MFAFTNSTDVFGCQFALLSTLSEMCIVRGVTSNYFSLVIISLFTFSITALETAFAAIIAINVGASVQSANSI